MKSAPKGEAAPTQSAYQAGPVYYPPSRKRRTAGAAVGIALFFIVPIILIIVFGSINFIPLGTLDYTVESTEITNVVLDIHNSIGSIDIIYDDSLTTLFEATLDVTGRPGGNIEEAKNFVSTNDSERVLITFDSGEFEFFFWNKKVFSYDILIYVNPIAIITFNIDADTGSIDLVAGGNDNLEIEELKLASNTGSVYANFVDTENSTIGDISLTSDTGTVTLNLGDALYTSIQDLNLETDTGRAVCDLGAYTTLNDTEVTITSSTGNVILTYENIILLDDINWILETNTGKVTANIIQDLVAPINYTATFDMNTDTGGVYLNYRFNDTIGYSMTGSTSTGSVNLPGPGESYQSPDFALKGIKYYFEMQTSTGSIYAVEV